MAAGADGQSRRRECRVGQLAGGCRSRPWPDRVCAGLVHAADRADVGNLPVVDGIRHPRSRCRARVRVLRRAAELAVCWRLRDDPGRRLAGPPWWRWPPGRLETEAFEHGLGIGTQAGRIKADTGRAVGKGDRVFHGAIGASLRVHAFLEEADLRQVRIGEYGFHRIVAHCGNIGRIEQGEPFIRRLGRGDFLDHGVEVVDIFGTGRVGREARILEDFRSSADLEELGPLFVGIGDEADIAVLRGVGLAVGIDRAGIGEAAIARDEGLSVQVFDHVEEGETLHHRDLDELAAPGALAVEQGGERRIGGKQANRLVGDERGRVFRRATGAHGVERGKAGRALNKVVIGLTMFIFAAGAESGAVDVDDVRIDRLDRFVAEAEPVHAGEADIVEENVGILEQGRQGGLAVGRFNIEHYGAFIAIQGRIDRTEIAGGRGPGIAHHVARLAFLAGLDLDHIGAEIPENQGREGAEHDRTHVDDLDAGKGAGGGFCGHGGVSRRGGEGGKLN